MLNTTLEGKTVGQVLEDLLDINLSVSEDCLHLAVSTPNIPKEVRAPLIAPTKAPTRARARAVHKKMTWALAPAISTAGDLALVSTIAPTMV